MRRLLSPCGPLLAAALLALTALPASAQDGNPPAPAKSPAEKPVPKPPAPEPEAPRVVFADNKVEAGDGWVVWFYQVNFVDPGVLRTELEKWKTKEAKIEPLTTAKGQATTVLRIQERVENLPLLEKMLELIDQPEPQVLVKAKLVEVSYDDSLEWGFEAEFDKSKADPSKSSETFFRGASGTFNPEAFLNASNQRPAQISEISFAFLGDTFDRYGGLDYVIRLLKSRGRAEILGEPNILATQGQKATLDAGERIPVQHSTLNGNNLVISTKFEDTGIKLEITPLLIGRDAVKMKLVEEFSAVTGFVTGQGGVQNPVINKRKADTTVTIRNGATLVVGGLQSSRTIESERGIPLLMDIPVLGWFFSSQDVEDLKTELYFFVTPEIVKGSYADSLIAPPGEKSRLEGLKSD